jgi:DNA-binding ferritin-like protein
MAASDRKKDKLNRTRPTPLVYAMAELIAERIAEVEGSPPRSRGHFASLQRITHNDADEVDPRARSAGVRQDNQILALAITMATFPAQV